MTPLSTIATPTNGSSWYGASALGLTFGGAQNIARGTGTIQHYTIIPLPAQPVDELTMAARAEAIASTYSGLLMQAVDLYRLTVERNGFMAGILLTMAHGFLGLPLSWQGDPEMVAALMDVRDHGGNVLTPGDYSRMHPENECAKIFSDGIGIGLGLGQYLLMCWRCDGVEWLRSQTSDAHIEVETCKRCGAIRSSRPIGARELYQLRWRDPRWLWRNTVTGQWYYTGRQAMVPITPGDGEWFLFQTVPDQDIWIHGPWALGTEAAIFTRDARYDMQAISATCAPTHVFQFSGTSGADPRVRADMQEQAQNLRFQNQLFIPGEAKHEIHAAQGGDGGYVGTADRITAHSREEWEVYITGIRQGTENGQGFANNGVLQRVSRERRAFYAGAWIRQIVAQGLVWWARGNFGSRPCPIGQIDTRSPEDKLAASKADTEEGKAIEGLVGAYAAVGYELDPAYIEERAQAHRIRVQPKQGPPGTRKIELGVDAVMACLRGGPALDALGVSRFGDERDNLTLTQLAAMVPGAPASPSAISSPTTVTGTQPSPPAARAEDDEEGDDDEEEAARLAGEYTARALDRCPYHGRTHACTKCRVQRVYGLDPATGEPRIAWRPMRRAKPSPDAKTPGACQPGTAVLP